MGDIPLLILFFAVSIVFSFLCSIWEAVLLSITPSYVQVKVQDKSSIGSLLESFKENIDRPLAAILTLNTIAHTAGAIGVGATASRIWPGNLAATIVSVVMTLAILFLSEIIPKTIGANNWKSLAPFTVKSLNFIIKALYPLVWFSQIITKMLKKEKGKSVLSRSDFMAMGQVASKTGVLETGESRILENLLKFKDLEAKDIMTPRTVVLAAQENQSINDFYTNNKNLRFSRIPVHSDSKDQISGFILKDDLLSAIINNKGDSPLSSIKRDIKIVTETQNLIRLYEELIEKKSHIALVVDEFGGMSGIVTMEDVVETLFGLEIMDEFDNVEDMQKLARKKWEERAKKLGLLEEDNS
jgi:CBS domain containing-hemolysin-like protein